MNDPQDHSQMDAGLIDKFLDNQLKELDLKAKDIDLQSVAEQHSFEYSKMALEKEAIDRNAHREFLRKCRKDTFLFISGISLLVIGLVTIALWLEKDQIAMEIIKDIIFLLSGGAGGYAIGSKKTPANEDDT